jgi:hypothetical protein
VIDMRAQRVVDAADKRRPVGIDASADGDRLFVADWYRNRLLVIDSTRRVPVLEIAVGKAPACVAAADSRVPSPSVTTAALRWSTSPSASARAHQVAQSLRALARRARQLCTTERAERRHWSTCVRSRSPRR